MLKFYVTLTLSVLFSTAYSQTIENNVGENSLPKKEFISTKRTEATPSLEEQGFTLFIVNEKKVYRKEVNGIIVEFTPEVK